MMTIEAAPAGAPSGEGLTFEKVWLMFQETDRKFREQMEEADRKFREEMKEAREQTEEADRKLREQMKETDRRFRETDRKISKLGSRLGELIEHLTGSNILEKF
ncbi:MAG: hypothetical protein LBG76_01930, partial [Treponema sp.]|nr:hypothetical protein [Treponema sp.]